MNHAIDAPKAIHPFVGLVNTGSAMNMHVRYRASGLEVFAEIQDQPPVVVVQPQAVARRGVFDERLAPVGEVEQVALFVGMDDTVVDFKIHRWPPPGVVSAGSWHCRVTILSLWRGNDSRRQKVQDSWRPIA